MARIAELSATVTAETGDFERGMSNVEKAVAGTRTTIAGLDRDFTAFGNNLGSTTNALHAMGAATDEASQTQNQLAVAQHNATAAANRLADAQLALRDNTHPEKQNELAREVAQAQVAMDQAGNAVTKLTSKMGGLGINLGSVSDAMNAMGLSLPITPMAALGSVVGFVGSQIKDSIEKTLGWADAMDKLARNTGASVEEASRMSVVTGYFGIQTTTLEMALKSLNAEGLTLNIKTLGKLAAEYQAMNDPVDRLAFATKNFGKAAQEMSAILELTPAKLRELGKAADASGKVMSGAAVDAAQELQLELAQLQAQVDGLKIGIGGPLVRALSSAGDQFRWAADDVRGWIKAIELLKIAEKEHSGIITAETAAMQRQIIAAGGLGAEYGNMSVSHREATSAAAEYNSETKSGAGALAELAGKLGFTSDGFQKAGRQAGGFTDSLRRVEDATLDAANASDMLAAGLAGNLQAAQEDYQTVMAETTPEIARLTDEIAKYQRQQGTSVTVTGEATTSVYEYELGALKAAEAQKKLAEFTGDDALELAQLRVSAEHAAAAVVKLGEGMGWSESVTLDFAKAIAEDSAAMAELVKKQEEAEVALRKATAEMVLQRTAALLGDEAAAEFARATGLMSEADYTLVKATHAAIAASDIDRSGTIDSAEERQKLLDMTIKLTDQTGDLATGTHTVAQNMGDLDARLPPVALGLDAVTTSAGLAREGIDRIPDSVVVDTTPAITSLDQASARSDYFGTRLDRLPTSVAVDTTPAQSSLSAAVEKAEAVRRSLLAIPNSITSHISIITDNYQNYHGYQIPGTGGPGAAMGADFIVPPGYPHDSYQMRVQSGEHVQVTPAGETSKAGGGGITINNYINDQLAMALEHARQRQIANARHESLM